MRNNMRKTVQLLLFITLLFVGMGCSNEVTPEKEAAESDDTNQIEENEDDKEPEINDEPSKEEEATEEAEASANSDDSDLSPLSVHYIDAGQGDATLFTFTDDGEDYAVLYDAGDWQGSEVVPYLQNQGIDALDIVIISHPHADHIGQLVDVLDAVDVDEVWMTENTASSGVFEQAAEAVLAHDVDYDEPIAGDTFDIGPLTAEVLHPSDTLTGDLNQDSLSILFTYGDMDFLFTGDAYVEQEQEMLSRTDNLSVDFLQLGHHGSDTSSGEQFIQAVHPTYAIYSAGDGNSYGHPHQEVLDRLQSIDATIYGTDVHGNIVITTDGETIDIETEKTGDVQAGSKEKASSNQNTNKAIANPQDKSDESSDDTQTETGDCIDVNNASEEQLQEIKHIGEKRAADIIQLRPFDSIDDLEKIDGIGPARIDDIKAENKACTGGN